MGSSGGGGGTGIVEYPAYMETIHSDWLDNTGTDTITSSITDIMDAAQGASPWAAATAYDPDADITALEAAIAGFDAILAGINEGTEWAALFTQAVASIIVADKAIAGITDAEIVDDSAAFGASLDNQIITTVLPRFQGGMRDINAVVSSAFVIGQAIIEGFRDTDVAKHESGLRVAAAVKNADVDVAEAQININKDVSVEQIRVSASDQMIRFLLQKYSWEEAYTKIVVEGKRIKIVAKKEENDVELKIDEADALWDLEVFQYGGNLLAAIGGGTASPSGKGPSQMQSALGGAMSGAAAGAMIGSVVPGIGTAVGAIAGAILGGGSAFL